jgi:hypothetical protein
MRLGGDVTQVLEPFRDQFAGQGLAASIGQERDGILGGRRATVMLERAFERRVALVAGFDVGLPSGQDDAGPGGPAGHLLQQGAMRR